MYFVLFVMHVFPWALSVVLHISQTAYPGAHTHAACIFPEAVVMSGMEYSAVSFIHVSEWRPGPF